MIAGCENATFTVCEELLRPSHSCIGRNEGNSFSVSSAHDGMASERRGGIKIRILIAGGFRQHISNCGHGSKARECDVESNSGAHSARTPAARGKYGSELPAANGSVMPTSPRVGVIRAPLGLRTGTQTSNGICSCTQERTETCSARTARYHRHVLAHGHVTHVAIASSCDVSVTCSSALRQWVRMRS